MAKARCPGNAQRIFQLFLVWEWNVKNHKITINSPNKPNTEKKVMSKALKIRFFLYPITVSTMTAMAKTHHNT